MLCLYWECHKQLLITLEVQALQNKDKNSLGWFKAFLKKEDGSTDLKFQERDHIFYQYFRFLVYNARYNAPHANISAPPKEISPTEWHKLAVVEKQLKNPVDPDNWPQVQEIHRDSFAPLDLMATLNDENAPSTNQPTEIVWGLKLHTSLAA